MKRHNPGCLCCRRSFYYYGTCKRVGRSIIYRHWITSSLPTVLNSYSNVVGTTITALSADEPDLWVVTIPEPWEARTVMGGRECCYALLQKPEGGQLRYGIAKIIQHNAEIEWIHSIPQVNTLPDGRTGPDGFGIPVLVSAHRDYCIFAFVWGQARVKRSGPLGDASFNIDLLGLGRANSDGVQIGKIQEDMYRSPHLQMPDYENTEWRIGSILGGVDPIWTGCQFTAPSEGDEWRCPPDTLTWTHRFGIHPYSDAVTRYRVEYTFNEIGSFTYEDVFGEERTLRVGTRTYKHYIEKGRLSIGGGQATISFSGEKVLEQSDMIHENLLYAAPADRFEICAKEMDRGFTYIHRETFDVGGVVVGSPIGRIVGFVQREGGGFLYRCQPVTQRVRYVNQEFGVDRTYPVTGPDRLFVESGFDGHLFYRTGPYGDSCEVLFSPPGPLAGGLERFTYLSHRRSVDDESLVHVTIAPPQQAFTIATFFEHYLKGAATGGLTPMQNPVQPITQAFQWEAYQPIVPDWMPLYVNLDSGGHPLMYGFTLSHVNTNTSFMWGITSGISGVSGDSETSVNFTDALFTLNMVGNGAPSHKPVWSEDSLHSPRPITRETWEDLGMHR